MAKKEKEEERVNEIRKKELDRRAAFKKTEEESKKQTGVWIQTESNR